VEQLSRDPFDAAPSSDRAHSHLIKIMIPQPPACFPAEIFAGRGMAIALDPESSEPEFPAKKERRRHQGVTKCA